MAQTITSLKELKEAIARLDQRRSAQREVIKKDMKAVHEFFSFPNLIRSFVKKAPSASPKGSTERPLLKKFFDFIAKKFTGGAAKSSP